MRVFLLLFFIVFNLFSYIIIEHQPLTHFIPDYRIKFSANMKEYYHNFESAQLHFKSKSVSEGGFYTVDMSCNSDNFCEAVIPAPMQSTREIEYFIEARDRIGDIYKTQNFSMPQVELPAWQIYDTDPITLKSSNSVTKDVSLKGFSEQVAISYITDRGENSHKINSKFIPSQEVELPKPDEQKIELSQIKSAVDDVVDLTGVWSIRRTLSTCRSGLYSHKVIKISSFGGKVTDSITYKSGTKFFYSNNEGFVCQLVDDADSGALVGEDSVYTYKSFFETLKRSLGKDEFVKLLEFSKDKIVFELHFPDRILTTIYKREADSLYF
jgi:hypothetical protein